MSVTRAESTSDGSSKSADPSPSGERASRRGEASVTAATGEQGGLFGGGAAVALREKNPGGDRPLRVSAPGDQGEREAERIADAIMRVPTPTDEVTPTQRRSANRIQRMCARCRRRYRQGKSLDCEECEAELQRSPGGREGAARGGPRSTGVERAVAVARESGRPLSEEAQSFFEPRMGADFSDVRVHTGPRADRAARSINAKAYTLGNDVVFRSGQYRPGTQEGKRLLGHELVHTMQQEEDSSAIQRYPQCLSSDAEECQRGRKEVVRSQQTPMDVESVRGSVRGLLVSNFAVGSGEVKPNLESHPYWARYWGQMVTNPNMSWEILGFSDCTGEESKNRLIRWKRAMAVNNALPQRAREQVEAIRAAPLDQCIQSDATEEGRARNRSALIRQVSTSYDFEPEEIESTKVCGPDVTPWLINRMQQNRHHPFVRDMRNKNSWTPSGVPHPDAVVTWVSLVAKGQPWDYKQVLGDGHSQHEDCRRFCEGRAWSVTLAEQCMTFEAPANIHYGFIGRHAGFSEQTRLTGAGLAQFAELRGEWGDDSKDRQAIRKGFELFDASTPSALDATGLEQNYYENLPAGEGDPNGCEPCPVELVEG